MYSDIEQSSGLLQQATEGKNRRKVKSALDELQERGVLLKYETDERKEERKITDVKYTLWATGDFISEQKAANKRASDANLTIIK